MWHYHTNTRQFPQTIISNYWQWQKYFSFRMQIGNNLRKWRREHSEEGEKGRKKRGTSMGRAELGVLRWEVSKIQGQKQWGWWKGSGSEVRLTCFIPVIYHPELTMLGQATHFSLSLSFLVSKVEILKTPKYLKVTGRAITCIKFQ